MVPLSDKDTTTGPKSVMKALGQNNPATMSVVWTSGKGVNVTGGLYQISLLIKGGGLCGMWLWVLYIYLVSLSSLRL
jgi:hypothetical protein